MTHGSLFSGIGGFDLAAEWMGWENKFHCEWNEFGQKVLDYYWPQAELFKDITKSDFKKYNGAIDIISGGFPCQPYSSAGKRLGKEDSRHLWPEMLRAIREIQPRWVVGENVRGLTNWNGGLVFDEVQSELEAEGYEVTPFLLPACAVNAPHRRDRIWFVAYSSRTSKRTNELRGLRCEDGKISGQGTQTIHDAIRPNGIEGNVTNSNCNGFNQCNSTNEINSSEGRFNALGDFNESNVNGDVADTLCNGRENALEDGQMERGRFRKSHQRGTWDSFPSVSPICLGNDGLPGRLDGITFPKWRNESIKAAGNAIVPQVVYQIFKAIQEYERIGYTSPNHQATQGQWMVRNQAHPNLYQWHTRLDGY
jgi:DNA (cytosine-5)-methyltransferase 1